MKRFISLVLLFSLLAFTGVVSYADDAQNTTVITIDNDVGPETPALDFINTTSTFTPVLCIERYETWQHITMPEEKVKSPVRYISAIDRPPNDIPQRSVSYNLLC